MQDLKDERMIIISSAGSKNLCITFIYNGKPRLVEPYSFRVRGGQIMFFGFDLSSNQIKCFKLNEMENVLAAKQSFVSRFPVEF